MVSDYVPCDGCGQHVHIDDLDFKPARLDRWWWHFIPASWAWKILYRAADTGEQFERGLCRHCFGPGYDGAQGRGT